MSEYYTFSGILFNLCRNFLKICRNIIYFLEFCLMFVGFFLEFCWNSVEFLCLVEIWWKIFGFCCAIFFSKWSDPFFLNFRYLLSNEKKIKIKMKFFRFFLSNEEKIRKKKQTIFGFLLIFFFQLKTQFFFHSLEVWIQFKLVPVFDRN